MNWSNTYFNKLRNFPSLQIRKTKHANLIKHANFIIHAIVIGICIKHVLTSSSSTSWYSKTNICRYRVFRSRSSLTSIPANFNKNDYPLKQVLTGSLHLAGYHYGFWFGANISRATRRIVVRSILPNIYGTTISMFS